MQLSIIIINYNTTDVTLNCLKSIKKYQSGFNFKFEIILVDNAPIKDCKNDFLEIFSDLIYLHSQENIGFGRANNWGMSIAKGKNFLLLNSDTILIDSSLNVSIEYLNSNAAADIGLIGCKLLNEDGTYQHSYYPFTNNSLFNYFKSNNPILNKIFKVNKLFVENNNIIQVGDVSGAFMLLRAEVYHNTKGFDPDFFLYCEETEWCRNRIAKKYKIEYFPKTQIIHLGGKSAPQNMMATQSAIASYLFWYKCSWYQYLGYFVFYTLNILTLIIINPFIQKGNRQNLSALIKNYRISTYYAIFKIPQFSKKFGARPQGLFYKAASSLFFRN